MQLRAAAVGDRVSRRAVASPSRAGTDGLAGPRGAVRWLRCAVRRSIVALGFMLLAGRTADYLVEITFTTLAAYGSFFVAEHYQCSGALAAKRQATVRLRIRRFFPLIGIDLRVGVKCVVCTPLAVLRGYVCRIAI